MLGGETSQSPRYFDQAGSSPFGLKKYVWRSFRIVEQPENATYLSLVILFLFCTYLVLDQSRNPIVYPYRTPAHLYTCTPDTCTPDTLHLTPSQLSPAQLSPAGEHIFEKREHTNIRTLEKAVPYYFGDSSTVLAFAAYIDQACSFPLGLKKYVWRLFRIAEQTENATHLSLAIFLLYVSFISQGAMMNTMPIVKHMFFFGGGSLERLCDVDARLESSHDVCNQMARTNRELDVARMTRTNREV